MRIREIKGKRRKERRDFWPFEESWRKRGKREKPEKREKGERS